MLISEGCSEDYLYFFSFLYFRYICSCTWVLWPFLTYIVLIFFIYVMYVSFTYTYMCCFFSLFMHMFLIRVCNLLFLFHTKIPWWFCLKCFRNTGCQSLLAINSLLAKFFKSLCYDRFYCIQHVNMSWVIYDFSHMFICLLWFCHGLPKWEIVGTYVIHLLGTYVTILYNWLIFWQNTLYLYLGRSRMCLILQETMFQDLVLKTCKSVQDSSWRSAVY